MPSSGVSIVTVETSELTAMISGESSLLRLPANLDRKQALFLDGLRHAADIATLAYERLRQTLTKIAREKIEPGLLRPLQTEAFVDAWALVDSIDRFRQLDLLFPQALPRDQRPELLTFLESTEPIRALRNVADHLAQRADQVVACEGTALGLIRWYTVLTSHEGLSCTLVPGRMQDGEFALVNPLGKSIHPPTCLIELTAGEHTASLSDAIGLLRNRVAQIEQAIAESHRRQLIDLTQDAAGADRVIKVHIATSPGANDPAEA